MVPSCQYSCFVALLLWLLVYSNNVKFKLQYCTSFYFRRLALVRADISRLPFVSGSIDAMHAGAAIHCWPSPACAVRSLSESPIYVKRFPLLYVFDNGILEELNNKPLCLQHLYISQLNWLLHILLCIQNTWQHADLTTSIKKYFPCMF